MGLGNSLRREAFTNTGLGCVGAGESSVSGEEQGPNGTGRDERSRCTRRQTQRARSAGEARFNLRGEGTIGVGKDGNGRGIR